MTKLRNEKLLKYDWQFIHAEQEGAELPEFDDSSWETVRVPHDWAISGPFNRENDLQRTPVIEDGVESEMIHTARTGGLPITGTGWYRKVLHIPAESKGKRIYIEFDGVMCNSTVYINGKEVGFRPFGYISFSYELTDHIKFGEDNLLAVKVNPEPFSSRWYPGAGIYRNVRLVTVDPVHVAYNGTYLTTPEVSSDKAKVNIKTEVVNQEDNNSNNNKEKTNSKTKGGQTVALTTRIINPEGEEIINCISEENIVDRYTFEQKLTVKNPELWDIDDPQLYKAISVIKIDGREVDSYQTRFGIRTISFDNEQGFFLNGKQRKLKGVCQHHDLGPLGAAVNYRGIERQLEILQEMGCNAIRTSHNPPAPELLDLCDKMGFLVIDEAFDEWTEGKVGNGYHKYFDEWAEIDLRAMIKRDRNHPCIIMWSIGNEIREQLMQDGAKVGKFLTEICHDEDSTRPVTAGFNRSDEAIDNGLAATVDIQGWNYKYYLYEKYHEEHSDWIMYGSETESCTSSRGEYFFPVEEEEEAKIRPNHHVTSYDLAGPPWAYSPDYEFAAQDDCEYMLGEFVWTGFDYLGEPTPYRTEWPSRSSYFGIIDLCGIPKDRYYLYQSHWSDKQVLHLLPHWNWEGREGEITPVHCYTSFDKVELFLNGKSLGVKEKNPDEVFGRYRLIWDNVKYEPGTLKVVAYDQEGSPAMTEEVKTAGKPAALELKPDRETIAADGDDLCYVKVSIVDKEGNLCPRADNLINFFVDGPAEIVGVGNGDQTSLESFQANYRQAFNGKCMLILRSWKDQPGEIKVKAKSEGLADAEIVIGSKLN